jgi:restriction system protein
MELILVLGAIVALVAFFLLKAERKFKEEAPSQIPLPKVDLSYRVDDAPNEDDRLAVVTAEARRILDESSKDPMMVAYNRIDQFINKHIDTLWAKKRQMTFVDDYGRENLERFEGELDYFVSRVIPMRLIEDYMATLPFDQSPSDCAKGIVREKLKWHNRTMNRRKDEAKARGEAVDSHLAYHPLCSGVEFESMVKVALEAKGYAVRTTPASGDQGVDLLGEKEGLTVAVQCKRSGSAVGNKAIQEVVAGRIHYGTDEAWVVSDADFTPGARALAQTNSVKLINFFAW